MHAINWAVLIITSLFSSSIALSAPSTNTPISIVLGYRTGRPAITIGSRHITNNKILDVLDSAIHDRGATCPIIVLVDERLSLADVVNIRGTIQKAGFLRIRYFYFIRSKEMMAEFSFGQPAIPFSLHPD